MRSPRSFRERLPDVSLVFLSGGLQRREATDQAAFCNGLPSSAVEERVSR